MKNILFIVDKRNWAYDDRAKNWQGLLSKDYKIDILYLEDYSPLSHSHKLNLFIKKIQSSFEGNQKMSYQDLNLEANYFYDKNKSDIQPIFNHKIYNGIYIFYHRALCDARLLATPIPLGKVAVGINNEKWTENGVENEYSSYVDGVKILTGSNKFIVDSFKKVKPNIFRVSQCVNDEIFFKNRPSFLNKRISKDMIVGWSGNHSNSIKNFENIKSACKFSKVKFEYKKDLSRNELNEWYNKLDSVICASYSEGGPQLLLEAGAIGLPVISTSVGLAREIIIHEKTGIIVGPTAKQISNGINQISSDLSKRKFIAENLQKEILKNWTYNSRVYEIRDVLTELLKE